MKSIHTLVIQQVSDDIYKRTLILRFEMMSNRILHISSNNLWIPVENSVDGSVWDQVSNKYEGL